MGNILNQTFLDLELCDKTVTVPSEPVTTEVIDLLITKEASCGFVLKGNNICYTVTIVNKSDIVIEDVVFRDPLDLNLTYVKDSFRMDDVLAEPYIDKNNVLTYQFNIPPNSKIEIVFCATAFKPQS